MQGQLKRIWEIVKIISTITSALGAVISVIFLAALQWSDVQAAVKEVPNIIAWKNQTNTDLAVMKTNIQELHDWYARDNGKPAK